MISVIKSAFKNYAVFSGRARRKEFGLYWLFCFLSGLLLIILASFIDASYTEEGYIQINTESSAFGLGYWGSTNLIALNPLPFCLMIRILFSPCAPLTVIVFSVFIIISFVPMPALVCRRLHDVGKSGKMMLLALIPLFGGIILLCFLIQGSQSGSNRYGPNPQKSEINKTAYRY